MASLTYNSNIFTKLNKWDNEFAYLGIQVSGKLNQYNGQDYPLLDSIDIDWNGAYINSLNTYVNTTEDLINVFSTIGTNHTNLKTDLKTNYYTKPEFDQFFADYQGDVKEAFDQMTEEMEDNILDNLINRYEFLNAVTEILIDKSKYLQVPYENIVQNYELTDYGKERDFYTFNSTANVFNEVTDKNYIINNPNVDYYIFIMGDIIKLNNETADIYNIIGYKNYNPTTNSYTYTGFRERFHNIEDNITYMSDYLDRNTNTTIQAYNYSYTAYVISKENKEKIGFHTKYNVYESAKNISDEEFNRYLESHGNNIFIKSPVDPTQYISIKYIGNPNYEYFVFHEVVPATGIEKEIEDINADITDNTYLLYHLHSSSDNSYMKLSISPDEGTLNRTIDRTINLNVTNSYVHQTGEITKGIVNYQTLIDSTSYLFSWKILK